MHRHFDFFWVKVDSLKFLNDLSGTRAAKSDSIRTFDSKIEEVEAFEGCK